MSFKRIDNNTLLKLHNVELEILKEFISICDKHHLNYFAVGGTLIGVIRHHGFIPWDDDIDIGMPRSDYDKFLEIAKNELNSKYFVQSGYDYKKSWLSFSKLRKKNTLANEENISHIDYPKGIFIDIFPFDNTNTKTGIFFKIKCNLIVGVNEAILYNWKVKKITEIRRKWLCIFLSLFGNKRLKKMGYRLMTKNNKKETPYFVSYSGSYSLYKETQPKNLFFPLKKGNFEGVDINIPNKYDEYLTEIYGNYMELPPKEKRVNHSMLEISFDVEQDSKKR